MDVSAYKAFEADLTAKFALPRSALPPEQLHPFVAGLCDREYAAYGLSIAPSIGMNLSDQKISTDSAIYSSDLNSCTVQLRTPSLGFDKPCLARNLSGDQWDKREGLPSPRSACDG